MADIVAKGVGILKVTDLVSKVGVGVLVGLLFSQFICGQKESASTTTHDTVTKFIPGLAIHDTTERWHRAVVSDLAGVPVDASDCPIWDLLSWPIDGDTLTLLGINAKRQRIARAFFTYKDKEIRTLIRDSVITRIKDSTVIHMKDKVAGLGLAYGPFVSTEGLGAKIDGRYERYHLYFAPKFTYADMQLKFWKAFRAEAGIFIDMNQ